ncbi:Arc family DNA-binding protein, partial [Actinomyces israelii]
VVPSIVIRGLDESVKKQLASQARENNRSMEAEARAILTSAVRKPHIGLALMRAVRESGGVEDLPVPTRTDTARTMDLG